MYTRKLLKGGGIPKCQCLPNCPNPPFGKSPFCRKHAKKGTCKVTSPLSGWEPHYMPTLYNGAKKIRTNHNCFAYAFDIMDPPTDCKEGEECRKPFHQPGYSAGYPKFSDTGKKYCPDLLARLFGDMPWLRRTTFGKRCRPGHSKIALVIDPDNDYHFYRQDSNGLWSHKPGGMPVTNRDASGKLIYNPELCDRDYRKPGVVDKDQLNYSIFCSFLCVPRTRPVRAKRGGALGLNQLSSLRRAKRGGGFTRRQLSSLRRAKRGGALGLNQLSSLQSKQSTRKKCNHF